MNKETSLNIFAVCLVAILAFGNIFGLIRARDNQEEIESLQNRLKDENRTVMHKQVGNDHFISLDEGNQWYKAKLDTYGGWKFSDIERAPADIQTHFEMLQAREDYIEKGGDNPKVLELLKGK